MRVINMTNNFKKFHEEISIIGKWKAFSRYYEKYNEIFDLMVKGLYMIESDKFRDVVDNTDFDNVLKNLESIDRNIIKDIEFLVNRSVNHLGFKKDFDLYIGVGLGHVAGSALPSENPSIYFGLECLSNCDLNFLVPHEVNHMVRIQAIKDISLYSFLERVITEGLGVIYPIILNKLPINSDTISKTLSISEEQVELLIDKEKEIKEDIIENFASNLDYELMNRFFLASDINVNKPILGGYYLGLRIVEKAISEGYSIETLTKLPSKDFVEFCKQL